MPVNNPFNPINTRIRVEKEKNNPFNPVSTRTDSSSVSYLRDAPKISSNVDPALKSQLEKRGMTDKLEELERGDYLRNDVNPAPNVDPALKTQ